MCTRYGIKPARSLEELEDENYLNENSNVLRNPMRAARS